MSNEHDFRTEAALPEPAEVQRVGRYRSRRRHLARRHTALAGGSVHGRAGDGLLRVVDAGSRARRTRVLKSPNLWPLWGKVALLAMGLAINAIIAVLRRTV